MRQAASNKNPMDIDSGLGSSYEEASNSSPFDMPSEIMSKQFSKLGATITTSQAFNY